MRDNNRAFIVTGYAAAKLMAETNVKGVRPGGKRIDLHPVVYWEDAPEEMRKDPKRMWITGPFNNMKKTFRAHTEEEKEEIRLNKKWRIEQIFLFMLEHYGWEYAERYAWEERENIEKFNLTLNLQIPHCENTATGQCDMFCPFFQGHCKYYKEEE